MHPAYSVIVFTTASGAGYGLLFWLAVSVLTGSVTGDSAALVALSLALLLITAGLLSSTLHLGHPERAIRAFSQWRSSWLSREGVAAIATYVPAGLLWLVWATGLAASLAPALAALSGVGAIGTVWCTGMIYASLRTIPEWHRTDVAPLYLVLAGGTGALLLLLVLSFSPVGAPAWLQWAALLNLAAGALLKYGYWTGIDVAPAPYTAEQATGLGGLGTVSPLDPPHTSPNFVMREMGYQVARKHAERLRRLSTIALFLVPGLLLLGMAIISSWPIGGLLATASGAVGVMTERWLFFAEARHVSMLYYNG